MGWLRFCEGLELDFLFGVLKQALLQGRPLIVGFAGFFEVGYGESSRREVFAVDDDQALTLLIVEQMDEATYIMVGGIE